MADDDVVAVPGLPRFLTVPDHQVLVGPLSVVAELDDETGARTRMEFRPYQGVRVTTEDCFTRMPRARIPAGGLYEVVDSDWVAQLRDALAAIDPNATFMDHAHHYVLPAGDQVVEVVAWAVEWGDGQFHGHRR